MSISDGVTISDEEEAVRRYTASSGIRRAGASRAGARPSLAPASLPVTDSDGESAPGTTVQERAQGAADQLAGKIAARFGTAPPLAHVHPPTLAEAHARLLADLARYEALAVRIPRAAYGYLHLGLKIALNAAEWSTRSPWGLLITVTCGYVILHWI